jgi:hypothetical protein
MYRVEPVFHPGHSLTRSGEFLDDERTFDALAGRGLGETGYSCSHLARIFPSVPSSSIWSIQILM